MTTLTFPLPDGLTVQALAGRWLHEGRALPLYDGDGPQLDRLIGSLTGLAMPNSGQPLLTFTLAPAATFPPDGVLCCATDASRRPLYFYAACPSEVAATP